MGPIPNHPTDVTPFAASVGPKEKHRVSQHRVTCFPAL